MRKVIAAPAAVVCSDCIASMMGLVYGADRTLFDAIVEGAAERVGGPASARRGALETYAGHYIDWAGAAPARIDNDGDTLTLTVRGSRFSGSDFDALAPRGSKRTRTPSASKAACWPTSGSTTPCRCRLSWKGADVDRQMFVRIHIAGRQEGGQPGPVCGSRYAACRTTAPGARRRLRGRLRGPLQADGGSRASQGLHRLRPRGLQSGRSRPLRLTDVLPQPEVGAPGRTRRRRPWPARRPSRLRFVQETWLCGDWGGSLRRHRRPARTPEAQPGGSARASSSSSSG